jgi:hypothetical protein
MAQPHPLPPTQVTDGIYVAIGYDLANTILIKTEEGHVVVDVAMNPERATRMRNDLEAVAGKAPIHSIIYTHSHVVSCMGEGRAWEQAGYGVNHVYVDRGEGEAGLCWLAHAGGAGNRWLCPCPAPHSRRLEGDGIRKKGWNGLRRSANGWSGSLYRTIVPTKSLPLEVIASLTVTVVVVACSGPRGWCGGVGGERDAHLGHGRPHATLLQAVRRLQKGNLCGGEKKGLFLVCGVIAGSWPHVYCRSRLTTPFL